MTRFLIMLPAHSQNIEKNLSGHVAGPQICQINHQTNSFQNMYGMLKATIYHLVKKIDFMQKNTSKSAILVDTNLDYLTSEGPGRQTVDTRLGAGLVLGSLGYDGSN